MLRPPSSALPLPCPRGQERGFTIVELVVTTAVLVILSTVGLRSMFVFNEQRKLRSAAVELAGYLQVARAAANSENAPCRIALDPANGGSFAPDPSPMGNACSKAGTLPPGVRLRGLVGSRNLQASVLQGAFPLTFSPEGTISQGATVLLSSVDVPDRSWCVNVAAPLATVRLGWLNADNRCNYTVDE